MKRSLVVDFYEGIWVNLFFLFFCDNIKFSVKYYSLIIVVILGSGGRGNVVENWGCVMC